MSTLSPSTQSTWTEPTDYERWYASSLGQSYAESLEATLRSWLDECRGARVLDAGCGPGLMSERLFLRDRPVVGLDCSLEMAERAIRRSETSGQPRWVLVGSVDRLPFADDSFDLVFCVNCLEFVENRDAAFCELARVVRPGGTAILGVLNRRSLWEVTRRLRRRFSERTYYRGRFFTRRQLRSCLEDAGLAVRDMTSAVHFPPMSPGPLRGVYRRFDRWSQRHHFPWGGVILCRAVKE